MQKRTAVSAPTRNNWIIDAAVFSGALLATLTGFYFLFLPIGGYQGGRNANYGLILLFERHTWDEIHTWGGILMIAAVVIHLALHWSWVKTTSRKVGSSLLGRGSKFSRGARINILVDLFVALGFFVTALSAIVFLFYPAGGAGAAATPLLSRAAWDILHTWGFILMIIAALLHIAIHWRWISKVSARIWASLWARTGPNPRS